MDEAVLHSAPGELDPGLRKQVTSLCFFPVVHAGFTGVFFLDRVRQQLGDGVPFSEYRGNVIAVYFCLFLREPAGISCPGYIPKTKGRRDILSTLAFLCEPEGLSPDGGLFYSTDVEPHQTGEPRGPLPSGGKTSAKSLFLYAPAR